MLHKQNYTGKNSSMSSTKLCISYIQRCCRILVSPKTILFIIIVCLLSISTLFLQRKTPICDPAEDLYWFCPRPNPQTTVCNWNDHFPTSSNRTCSPESYEKFFSSLPKRQSSFEFNNLTFAKCNEQSIDILIFVISRCSHGSIRQTIRRTWGNTKLLQQYFPKVQLKVLFLVDIDSKSEKKIELEYKYHKDIVQVTNLPEQYEYVTEREAALYQFVTQRCNQTKFIFKTDDDIFLNTFLLLLSKENFEYLTNKNKYSLFGFPMEYAIVFRHSDNPVVQRYIVTADEYSCPRYPTFLSGFGYLMSFETCSLFLNAYLTDRKPFPLSDVYFTGLLSEMVHIQRQTIVHNVGYRYETGCNEDFFTSQENAFACAASNDHFNGNQAGGGRSLMSDYNLYWTQLTKRYDLLRTRDQ